LSFFSTLVGKCLKVFVVSMFPILELRGAIPVGVADGLNIWICIIVAIIGNLVPVPFIILFVRKIFALARRLFPKMDKFISMLENRAKKKSDKVLKYTFWGLFVLVAIPLPGTGAWTGALVAAMLDVRLKRAFPSIALGVIAASIIVTIVTYGVKIFLF